MLRKLWMVAVMALLCMPIGGSAQIALGRHIGRISAPALSADWWLGPYELGILSGCLFVLSLTVSLRRQ